MEKRTLCRPPGGRTVLAALSALLAAAGCESERPGGAGPKACAEEKDCGAQAYCQAAACLFDPDPPVIEITEQPPKGSVFSEPEALVRGKVTDTGSGVRTFEASWNGGAFAPVALSGSDFELRLPVPDEDQQECLLVLRARDAAKNPADAMVSFTSDRWAPRLDLTVPVEAASHSLDDPLLVAGTATDQGLASVKLSIDGAAPSDVAWNPDGSFSELPLMADSDHREVQISVAAKDAAGSETVVLRTVRLDRRAPVVFFSEPPEAKSFSLTDPEKAPFAGAADDVRLASVVVSWNGTRVGQFTSAQFSGSLSLPLVDHRLLVLEAVATDESGNSATVRREIAVDRVAPRIAITSPPDAAVFALGSPQPVLDVSVSDDAFVGLAVLVDGTRLFDSKTPSASRPLDFPVEDRTEHVLTVVALDRLGNVAEASRRIVVDRVAPSVVSSAGDQRHVKPGAALVTFSEKMDLSSVTAGARLNGASAGSDVVSLDGLSVTVRASALAPFTTHLLEIVGAKDLAGNAATPVAIRFQTEPALPPAISHFPSAMSPVVAVDPDGRPAILLRMPTGIEIRRWDGRGAFVSRSVPATGWQTLAFDLGVSRFVGLDPVLEAHLLFSRNPEQHETGERLSYLRSADGFASWDDGTGRPGSFDLAITAVTSRPVFLDAGRPICTTWNGDQCAAWAPAGHRSARFPMPTTHHVLERHLRPNGWSEPEEVVLGNTAGMMGRDAFYDQSTFTYLPDRKATPLTVSADHQVTGVAGLGPFADAGGVSGSALIAWTEGRWEGAVQFSTLRIACRDPSARAGPWRASGNLGASLGSASFGRLTLERSREKVAVLVETLSPDPGVKIGTFADAGCATAPGPIAWTHSLQGWDGTAAYSSNGVLWVAHSVADGAVLVRP